MKCTTCGYETQPGAKFCVQCGTTIVAGSPPAGMAPLAAPSLTPRPAAAPPMSSPSTSATAARPAYTPPAAPSASATASRPAYTPPASAPAGPSAAATPAIAAMAASPSAAPAQSMRLGLIAGVLVLLAVLGFKRNYWLLVAALVGHGVFDFVRHFFIDNPGVPQWWPGFCLASDVVFGAWVAVLIITRRQPPVNRSTV